MRINVAAHTPPPSCSASAQLDCPRRRRGQATPKAPRYALAPRIIMPDPNHLSGATAFRGIEVDTQMIAAAVMREWNPLQVVPVVPDAWIRLRFHTVEIASVDETFQIRHCARISCALSSASLP